MPELFTHCLFAMAVESLVSLTLGLDGLDQWSFIAGMLAMSLNMDTQHLPGCKRGPFSHSVAGVLLLLSFIGLGSFLTTTSWLEIVIASGVGLISHLFLDSFTEYGIYLWPRIDADIMKNIFSPYAHGGKRWWSGWKGFKMPVTLGKSSSPKLNIMVSIPSLITCAVLLVR